MPSQEFGFDMKTFRQVLNGRQVELGRSVDLGTHSDQCGELDEVRHLYLFSRAADEVPYRDSFGGDDTD